MSKPCKQCPWTQKGRPLITPDLEEASKKGTWFCCHVNMGTCFGAKNVGKKFEKVLKNN